MATLPIILSPGQVAVYGVGGTGITDTGMVLLDTQRYGTIYNIWDGGATYIYGNTQVVFNESDVFCRVVASDLNRYTILPAARLVTENIIIPP